MLADAPSPERQRADAGHTAEVAPTWGADPSGRFAQRYWDGLRWTELVAGPEGGAPLRDPAWAADPSVPGGCAPDVVVAPDPVAGVPSDGAGRWAPDPTGRYAQRYWSGAQWTDFVAGVDGGPPVTDPIDGSAVVPEPAHGDAGSTLPPLPASDKLSVHWYRRTRARDGVASPSDRGRSAPAGPTLDSPPPSVTPPSTPVVPAGWHADPTLRQSLRYWDGREWTELGTQPDGTLAMDPLGARLANSRVTVIDGATGT